MRIANEDMIAATPVTIDANKQLRAVWLGHICNYSIQLVFTGTPNGAFSLQASDDAGTPDGGTTPQASNVTHWTDVTGSSQSISAAGNLMYQVQNAGYNWVRVIYTASSSTGTLTSARINIKGV